MRQAWLIMAHNEFEVLRRLVSMLDAPESDIYIHFDKKVSSLPQFEPPIHARLFVLQKRLDARWGDVSLAKTELLLMETALANGPYSHYHIISGVHLPLKPYDDLIRFYDSHGMEEIVHFWPEDAGDADFKLRRYHFPIRNFKSTNRFLRFLCQLSWRAVIYIQKTLGIKHLKKCNFLKTDQWISLTEGAVKYLTDHKKTILQKYKWSFCCDEYFIATELSTQPGHFRIYDCPNLLYVRFTADSPESLPLSAYSAIQQSGYYWARKFTSNE
ncbi:MAG: glycosyl transferase [Bacteroidales bacterium]|nr:glycosyl transferase [Bacteroidales bacterium]